MRKKRIVNYKECPKCHDQIGSEGFNHHVGVCQGLTKLEKEALKAKPGRPGHKGSNQYKKAREEGRPIPVSPQKGKPGKTKGYHHTEEFKQKQSIRAKQQGFGGHNSKQRIMYKGVQLHSSYETRLAADLDANSIKWIRPSPMIWRDDKNKDHRYYADFYLPDYDIYLDPKNDFLIEHVNPAFGITDREKIELVAKQNNAKIFILNKDQLTWEAIRILATIV